MKAYHVYGYDPESTQSHGYFMDYNKARSVQTLKECLLAYYKHRKRVYYSASITCFSEWDKNKNEQMEFSIRFGEKWGYFYCLEGISLEEVEIQE